MVREERLELSQVTPLEPKSSASTNSATLAFKWGGRWGSNPRPPESQSGALPTELRPPLIFGAPGRTRTCYPRLRRPMLYPNELQAPAYMVGAEGFEPPTPWSQTRCATKLRYAPNSMNHTKIIGSVNE